MREVLAPARDARLGSRYGTCESLSVRRSRSGATSATLARQGLVARVRGGVRALPARQSELGFDFRLRLEVERKRAIAQAAAAMVDEGEAVALDSSTTAYYLALELREKQELVVVTNGLLIAAALADAPGITVLVTGGMLRLHAMSLVGDLGADVLRATRISKGFLGARGLSLDRGLMDLNPDEVRIKREMADACERVIGILDGTKWHRTALLPFVPPEQLDAIVTDTGAPEAEIEAWHAPGWRSSASSPLERARPAASPRAPPSTASETTRVRWRRWSPSTSAPRAAASPWAATTASGWKSVRCIGSRTSRWPLAAFSSGTSSASSATSSRPTRRERDAGTIDSVGVDSWGVDFGLLDRTGRPPPEPRPLPRRAPGPGGRGRSSAVPARELYERTGIQLMPINTMFELAALAADDDPVLETAETLLLIPDLMHYWLGGRDQSSGRTPPRRSASTPRGRLGARPPGAARDPAAVFPEIVRPGPPRPAPATRSPSDTGPPARA